jgi:AhpD family alkylhydroperoxidase
MSESQVALNENRVEQLDRLVEELPEEAQALWKLNEISYQDGALSAKTKRLLSMAIALGVGCRNCVLAQTRLAIKNGATKQEILEVISVVMSMRGTTGVAESLRVIQLLDEMEEL